MSELRDAIAETVAQYDWDAFDEHAIADAILALPVLVAAFKVVEAARGLPTDVLGGIAADVAHAWFAAKELERKAFYQRVIDDVRELDTAVDEYDAVVKRDE